MERLIYSSSPISTKNPLKSPHFTSRVDRVGATRLGFSQVSSASSSLSKRNGVFSSPISLARSPVRCSSVDSSSGFSPPKVNLLDQLKNRFPLLKRVAGVVAPEQEKGVPAGAVILLSALILFFVHPALAPQAYATVHSVAQSGGHIAAAAVGGKIVQTELLTSAWGGFFAGCLHTLSGPDHLAALAPLSIGRTKMENAAVGALWGFGHDAGQVIFGLLFLLLKDRLHIQVLQVWGTRVVGLTLLVIGAMGIKEASEVPAPCVTLENGECDVSLVDALETSKSVGKTKIGFATFATGIVHGLQPDALMMVLPALAMPSRLAGAAFLGMFLLGTVIAMGSYTVFIGSCTDALKERVPKITEKLTWLASLVAIALGFAILISQYFGYNLY